jgi:hypothetical protein
MWFILLLHHSSNKKQRPTDWLTCRRFGKTPDLKITFSIKWPPCTRAEGGQVEPVLGELFHEFYPFLCRNRKPNHLTAKLRPTIQLQ